MNCGKARELAALYAGGDLNVGDSRDMFEHMNICPSCKIELERLTRTVEASRTAGIEFQAPFLPSGFADTVMNSIENDVSIGRAGQNAIRPFIRTLLRYSTAAAAVIVCAVMISGIRSDQKEYTLALVYDMLQREAAKPVSELTVENGRIGSFAIEGPIRLSDWKHIDDAGIYAVLHKPDPENSPDTYIVDYLGEAGKLSFRGFTWQTAVKQRLLKRAENENNIYIAVYRLPRSSERERSRIAQHLIRKYKPYFNTGA